MRRVTGVSADAGTVFSQLKGKAEAVQRSFKDFGSSIGGLKQKIDLLQRERDIIDPKSLTTIRQYNREIERLNGQITKLETTKGGRLKNWMSDLSGNIPSIAKNPLTLAAAGIGLGVKNAMSFDEGMAKVNITARLEGDAFEELKRKTKKIAQDNKADEVIAPIALEKIISQVGDVDASLSILDATLKGSKSQFADMDTVAGALAQTLSIVGKNATAAEVLDTFIASKRVGAGEFSDFANYMPSLIAGADALGIKYKEVAGLFAYATGKGQSPERASVLMSNMFSMLGRGEVTSKMKKAGINVFDNTGKIRSTLDIFRDMQKVMSKMSDQKKAAFLENLGIVDKEAKGAFMVMTSDLDKLERSLGEVANSAGETDRALAFSANSLQRAHELWYAFKSHLVSIGDAVLPLVNAGMSVLNMLLDGASWLIGKVADVCGAWFTALQDGNPLVWGLTAAVAAGTTIYAAHTIALHAHAIALAAVNLWNKVTAFSTGILHKAMLMLRTAFLTTPWGWVALGIGAIAAGIAGLTRRTETATQTFAAFNAELRKTQEETRGSFDTAMQAAEGSQERTEAIKKLNEQYGTYLPALLTEKTTNDELRDALDRVNIELERKIANKFRDQAKEDALGGLEKKRATLFGDLIDQVPLEQRKQFAADFNTAWSDMYDGSNVAGFDKLKKYGVDIMDLKGSIVEIVEAMLKAKAELGKIDLLYNSPAPQSVTNNYNVSMPWETPSWMPQNSEPFRFFQPGDASGSDNKEKTKTTTGGTTLGWTGGSSGSSKSAIVDLNKLGPANVAGSGAYKAISSRLSPKTIPSLAAAVAAATLPVSVAAPDLSAVPPPGVETAQQYDAPKPALAMSKFCDNIVIHIANADGQGYEAIEREIEQRVNKVMRKLFDDYQA